MSRAAGLLAIAVLGIAIFSSLIALSAAAWRISTLPLPCAKLSMRNATDLPASNLPNRFGRANERLMRNAINLSFVDGFRRVMLAGAALAFGSAVTALLLVRGVNSSRPQKSA